MRILAATARYHVFSLIYNQHLSLAHHLVQRLSLHAGNSSYLQSPSRGHPQPDTCVYLLQEHSDNMCSASESFKQLILSTSLKVNRDWYHCVVTSWCRLPLAYMKVLSIVLTSYPFEMFKIRPSASKLDISA
jgi:hypothetical protein